MKIKLILCAAVFGCSYAGVDVNWLRENSTNIRSTQQEVSVIDAQNILDSIKWSYGANKSTATDEDNASFKRLKDAGWNIESFKGTTGLASYQQESVAGIFATNGKDVIVSFRGTELTNLSDWATNLRIVNNGVWGLWQDKKMEEYTKNNLGISKGQSVAGYAQSVESSAAWLNERIRQYMQEQNCLFQDLNIHFIGHSQGGGKAELAAIKVLKHFEPKTNNNVKLITFNAPSIWWGGAAKEAETKIGTQNIMRVESSTDIVCKMMPFLRNLLRLKIDNKTGNKEVVDTDNSMFNIKGNHSMQSIAPKIMDPLNAFLSKTKNSIKSKASSVATQLESTANKVQTKVENEAQSAVHTTKTAVKSFWGKLTGMFS